MTQLNFFGEDRPAAQIPTPNGDGDLMQPWHAASELFREWESELSFALATLTWGGYCLHCLGMMYPLDVDFCESCNQAGLSEDRFGRCYQCRDTHHDQCVGVPCECKCPWGFPLELT